MRTRDVIRAARKDGRRAGLNAASWAFDGNTKPETYRRALKGLEDGDPEILDAYRTPDLSGEWADSPTPRTLQSDYDVDDDRWERIEAEVCDAWLNTADEAFWREVARICRFHLDEKKETRR